MTRSFFAMMGAAISLAVMSIGGAHAGGYPFGDQPYTLDWTYHPQIQSGCWRWNWQEYQWDDHCPVYVYPKAYMYPPASRVVLPTKY